MKIICISRPGGSECFDCECMSGKKSGRTQKAKTRGGRRRRSAGEMPGSRWRGPGGGHDEAAMSRRHASVRSWKRSLRATQDARAEPLGTEPLSRAESVFVPVDGPARTNCRAAMRDLASGVVRRLAEERQPLQRAHPPPVAPRAFPLRYSSRVSHAEFTVVNSSLD